MTRTKNVSREKYVGFMEKAEAYYDSMLDEFEEAAQNPARYNSCITMAVHCAISWVDALTVSKLGKKSSDSHHAAASILLKDIKASDEEKKSRVRRHFYNLMEMKTPCEYEDKLPSKANAKQAVRLCEKIRDFVKKELEGM
ncbi:HEPN domain-containing protein [Candidatus Micrarchaeota archaeon]|nr:HEPN domain-containing protein [Candidatus Micrarchaeota archaeon]